jgi:ADP-ribose pyrophosphatase YjhB (NUDIX family)
MPKTGKGGKCVEIIATAHVFDQSGKMLLLKQKNGWWTPPGGHVENGERIIDAARREAKEETGLDVEPVGVFSMKEVIEPSKGHWLFFDVICDAERGRVAVDGKEAIDYLWASPEEALKMQTHFSVSKIATEYVAQKHSGTVRWIMA